MTPDTSPIFRTLAVVGAGNMGSGIAQKMASEGFDVVLVDVDEERVARGLTTIDRMLAEAVERRVTTADRAAATRARVRGTPQMDAVAEADLVIEAVFEDRALKQDVFRRLDSLCAPETILATNTSSYLVDELASVVRHPARVIGLHYFYHPAKNHLVEVIAGANTDPAIVRRAWTLQERMRKIPIASRDAYGFVVNRFFVVWMMEAVRMLEEGVANEATIDAVAKEAFGVGMGPFELMNVTGIPIAFHASTTIGHGYGPMYGPPARLREQLDAATVWPLDGVIDRNAGERVAQRLFAMTFLVAAALVDEGVGTKEDTDLGARVGLRWPAGPFELMNRQGTARALAIVSPLAEKWNMSVPRSLVEAGRTNATFPLVSVLSGFLVRRSPEGEGGSRTGIATITINRPDTMNALNETVVAELAEAFRIAAADPAASGIVISGSGRSFVAGADIKFFIQNIEAGTLERVERFTEQAAALLLDIDRCPKPVVARIHGLALGGGVELALACDYIVAAEGSTLGMPETGIGIYPGLGGTQRTTRRIGRGLTKWLVMTGRIIEAQEAAAIGLIDRVVPHEQLDAAAADLIAAGPVRDRKPAAPPLTHAALAAFFETHEVDEIRRGRADTGGNDQLAAAAKAVAAKAPIAVRIAAELIDRGADMPLEDALRLERSHVKEVFLTQDALTGLRSVGGKSRPAFEGR